MGEEISDTLISKPHVTKLAEWLGAAGEKMFFLVEQVKNRKHMIL